MNNLADSGDYFNLALFPDDQDLLHACIELAQINFKEVADQYLLGNEAWPHITVCQFKATTNQLDSLWSAVNDLLSAPLQLRFTHIYVLAGKNEHLGMNWVGLTVAPEIRLIALQRAMCERLAESKIESLTASKDYFPHLTWARCSKPLSVSQMPQQDFWSKSYPFSLTIGRSNQNGVYKERLYPR